MITTIILSYRRPQLLRRAIESVLNQTYPHFQLFICDNASCDETESIVSEYTARDPRVKYFCHATNIGMIKNYQFGLSLVKTKYFSFLSDDDVLLPWFYETALEHFAKTPEAGFFAGSTIVATSEKVIHIPHEMWTKEGVFSPSEATLEMIGKYPIPTSVLFHSKIRDVVEIDEENCLFWDCDYILNVAARFPVIISKKPCAVYLHHVGCFSVARSLEFAPQGFQRLAHRIETSYQLSESQAKEGVKKILEDHCKWSFHHKRFTEARCIAQNLTGNNLAILCLRYSIFACHLLRFLQRVKRWLIRNKIQPKFKQYCAYLKETSK